MEEKKNMLRVHMSGMMDGKKIEEKNYEGKGFMVFVDNGECIESSIVGDWSAVSVGTALMCMKKGDGTEMFKDALGLYLANVMAKMFVGGDEEDPEEAENERKAAAAAGEAQNGAEA